MKRMAVFILGVIAVVVVADLALGLLSRYYLQNHRLPGDYQSVDYVVKDCDAEVLIIGSSVALNSLMPKMIEDSLGMTCYNAAANGQQLPFHLTLLRCVLSRYTPKMVVLGVTPDDFTHTGVGQRYNVLVPYYKCGYSYLDSCMESTQPLEKWFLKSNLYRYNTIWLRILLYHFITPDQQGENGFVAKDVPSVMPELTTLRFDEPMSDERAGQLEWLVATCREKGIRLVVYSPPLYSRIEGTNECVNQMRDFFNKNDIQFFDDSQDELYLSHQDWFYDNLHLNYLGAEVYTKDFIKRLQPSTNTTQNVE